MTNFRIVVEQHDDGFVAYPLGIKGVVVGQGDTYETALADVSSAIQFHLGTFGTAVACHEGIQQSRGVPKLLNTAQFKRMADTVNALGLAAVIGGVGDAAVNNTRPTADRLGIIFGSLLLIASIWLSRWENNGDRSTGLTPARRRR